MTNRPYHSLRHADFRRLWIAQLVSLTGSQMQYAAIDWHIYLLTHSPLALGAVGLVRVMPIVAFSLGGGVVADRYDRKRVLFTSQSAMMIVALALAAATFAGRESLPLLYLVTAATSAAGAFDNPARQALIPRLVPRADLPGALAVNLAMFHAAMITGPALTGFLIASGSRWLDGASAERGMLAVIYAANALSFAGVLLAIVRIRASGVPDPPAGGHETPRAALAEGLRFVFTTPLMVWTMTLDFVATFFSGAMSLLPIFADQILKVGAEGFGWLRAAPALGAMAGSIWTAFRPLPRRHGEVFLVAVAIYGASTAVFGLSKSFWLTLAALALSGLADLVSTVVRQILRQMITPDAMRGRMTSVNMIFFMGGPQLGEMEAGLVASLFATAATGAVVSVVSGGVATVLAAAVVALAAPTVRRYRGHSFFSSDAS